MAKLKGKVISVASLKGGVGKSVITMTLAKIYSDMHKKVLIVDMDLCKGSIALMSGITYTKSIYNFYEDMSTKRFENGRNYITKYTNNIDILPCPKDPRYAPKTEYTFINDIIDNVSFLYDIVLIDVESQVTKASLATLDSSDKIIYVVCNEPLSVKNAKNFTSLISEIERFDDVTVLLNNSVDPEKNSYSLYELKTLIGQNVDYTISKNSFSRDIDSYIEKGKIIEDKTLFRDEDKLIKMCNELIEEEKEG